MCCLRDGISLAQLRASFLTVGVSVTQLFSCCTDMQFLPSYRNSPLSDDILYFLLEHVSLSYWPALHPRGTTRQQWVKCHLSYPLGLTGTRTLQNPSPHVHVWRMRDQFGLLARGSWPCRPSRGLTWQPGGRQAWWGYHCSRSHILMEETQKPGAEYHSPFSLLGWHGIVCGKSVSSLRSLNQ